MSAHPETLFNINKYKEGYKMKKLQMTRGEFDLRMIDYAERYGNNPLDWPSGLRAMIAKFEIVREVSLEWRQLRLGEPSPYGNTGVTNENES